jgi:DNA-binding NtrC family response regulator
LGSTKEYRANVRIIAASGVAPEELLDSRKIRRDLYYRINVLQLRLPPLRKRREDIIPLAGYFLEKYLHESKQRIEGFSREAAQKLLFYDWPGNVRELAHVIERAVAHLEKGTIQAGDIELPEVAPFEPLKDAKERFVVDFERRYIQQMLSLAHGNISEAARTCNKHRRAFWQLIRKHSIDAQHYSEIRLTG